jgi:hypothetical protein
VEWRTVCFGAISLHQAGVSVGFLDGSDRFVNESVSPPTWWTIATKAGRDAIGDRYGY